MRKYIQFIYDDVASLYAGDRTGSQHPDPVPTASEFANTIDGFACSGLFSKGFVLYLGWERQTSKWVTGGLKNISAALANGFVIGNTIKKETGHRVDVYSQENVLNLFDTDREMASKLFGPAPIGGVSEFFTDLTNIRNICIGPGRLEMSDWDYMTLQRNTTPVQLEATFAAYRKILELHTDLVAGAIRPFLDPSIPLTQLPEQSKIEVCARCAAYTKLQQLRDGGANGSAAARFVETVTR